MRHAPCDATRSQRVPRRPWRREAAAAALVGLATLALALVFLRDPLGQDDRRIFAHAHQFLAGARGTAAFAATHYRVGFVLEHAAAQALLGYSPAAYYTVALANSTATVLALYFLLRLFWPRIPAVLAALAFATNPYFLAQSSWPQIDWPAAWRYFAGLGLAIIALRSSGLAPRQRYLAAAAAGLCFWWSFYTKASVAPLLVLVPTLPLFVRFDRTSWKAVPVVALAAGAGLALGFGLDQAIMGDAWACLRKVREAQSFEFSQETYLDKQLIPLDLTWADLVLRYPALYWAQPPGQFFLAAAGIGAVFAVVRRRRPLLLFLVLGLACWAAISLMVTSTDPLIPVLRTKDRYFSAAFGLLFLVSAGAAIELYLWFRDDLRSVATRRVLAGAGVLLAGLLVYRQVDFHARGPLGYDVTKRQSWDDDGVFSRVAELARQPVAGRPASRIVTDSRMAQLLTMFTDVPVVSFDPTGERFEFESPADFSPRDLVYVQRARLRSNAVKYYRNAVPEFIWKPPGTWFLLYRSGPHAVYYVLDLSATAGSPLAATADLLPHLHAYLHERNDPGRISVQAAGGQTRVTLENVADGRLVLGPQRYTKRPPQDLAGGALQITRPGWVVGALVVRPEGEVTARELSLAVFRRDEERPTLVRGELEPGSDGSIHGLVAARVDPQDGGELVNLLVKVSGTGTFTIEECALRQVTLESGLP